MPEEIENENQSQAAVDEALELLAKAYKFEASVDGNDPETVLSYMIEDISDRLVRAAQ